MARLFSSRRPDQNSAFVPLYESPAFWIPLVGGILESGTAYERLPAAGRESLEAGLLLGVQKRGPERKHFPRNLRKVATPFVSSFRLGSSSLDIGPD